MTRRTNHLRCFCKRAGITQAELARRIGVSPEWISKIAHGKAEFSELTERRIVRALNLTNDEARKAFRFPHPSLFDEWKEEGEPGSNVREFPSGKRGSSPTISRPGSAWG